MLIKKIKIKNFRQYYGEVEIEFSTDEIKNVTVIRGENGVGKTALLNAVKWAFFETFTNNFPNKNKLINNTALKEGKKKCSVEIEFEEDGVNYLLIREFEQQNKNIKLKLFPYDENTLRAELPNPNILINTMLPREMAEYFFFQGEGSNAVNVGNNGSDLAKSIQDILGFEVANKLIIDLKSLLKNLRNKRAELDTSGKAKKLQDTLNEIESKIDDTEYQLGQKNKILPSITEKIKTVEESLDKIKNKNLSSLKSRERSLESEISGIKTNLNNARKNKISNISKFGWAVFGIDLASTSQDFIDDSELKGKLPEPYNETFIKDILAQKECICGTKLHDNKSAFEKIAAMLSRAANPELMQRLSGIRAQIQDIKTLYELSKDNIKENLNNLTSLESNLINKEKELSDIIDQINDIPEDEIKSLQKQKFNLVADQSNTLKSIGALTEKLEELNAQLDPLKRAIIEATPDDKSLENIKLKIEFVDDLMRVIDDHLKRVEKNIRLHVFQEVNKSLQKFSRHDFKITVDKSNFSINLLDKDNNPVNQGDGLNLLLNLTITSSLINFAASRRNIKDPILSSATVAPLLIDAPFGVLDNKYRNVVVSELPKQARQIIFLVSSSQWSEEMDSEIRDKVGKEYVLILEESGSQGDKEIDILNIRGNKKAVSRYDCDIDRTVVENVL
tara:strand:+ start:2630 stop:4657 length:2028 start_codon:yes stop_codon:yes gene_type:complete